MHFSGYLALRKIIVKYITIIQNMLSDLKRIPSLIKQNKKAECELGNKTCITITAQQSKNMIIASFIIN